MSSIDELPPDQRAALSLVLRQRKGYEDLAQLLKISPQAVHDRAHAALAVLAPAQARGLDAAEREQIGEYLLGRQSDAGARLRTRTLLSSSPAAAAWARSLAAQLETLAPGALPEIPGGEPAAPASAEEPANAGPAREHPRPSSRVGGALLLAAIVAVVVVVVVFVSKGGSSSHRKTGTTTTASGTQAKVEGRVTLHPPSPASPAMGTVQILSEGSKRAFFIQAEHLAQTSGRTFYAIWLYNSPTSALALSKAPAVGPSHKLAGAALLPGNAASYREILLTRETSTRPSRPGPIVLRGALNLSG
ncbi:MAG TPA: sigma-70 region 4 domain-containing protein [Solirubrobacteraceae bacterium]|jgi:hypothetical protein|nr:sigma-70 region 4 domain-containing protein [Solirubrobacteraceae bacterium]